MPEVAPAAAPPAAPAAAPAPQLPELTPFQFPERIAVPRRDEAVAPRRTAVDDLQLPQAEAPSNFLADDSVPADIEPVVLPPPPASLQFLQPVPAVPGLPVVESAVGGEEAALSPSKQLPNIVLEPLPAVPGRPF